MHYIYIHLANIATSLRAEALLQFTCTLNFCRQYSCGGRSKVQQCECMCNIWAP